MTKIFRSSFIFIADRYEEWQLGRCISSGHIDTTITAKVVGNKIHFELSDINKLRILQSFEFDILGRDYCILPDRIQYVHTTSDFDPITPVVCHIFYTMDTINYVRFAMTNPDRIIEFYGHVDKHTQSSTPINAVRDTPPSQQTIRELIETIQQVQKIFNIYSDKTGNSQTYMAAIGLETFLNPLFFAWEKLKYGWHTDFLNEGDSMFGYMMFATNIPDNIQNVINNLRTQSPFAAIEKNGRLTQTLITTYEYILEQIQSGQLKI